MIFQLISRRNTACRSRPLFVRSTNSSSQRRSGFTHTQSFIFSAVRPCPDLFGSGRNVSAFLNCPKATIGSMKSSRTGIGQSGWSTGTLHCFTPCPGRTTAQNFGRSRFALKNLKQGNVVLDGEVVALDERGRASFQELQNRKTSRQPIIYYVFDLLHFNGRDTLDLPLSERKQLLEKICAGFSVALRLNPLFRTKLAALVKQVKALGLEGIVAKRARSIYIPGKESDACRNTGSIRRENL